MLQCFCPVSHDFSFTLVHYCRWSEGCMWVGKWKERNRRASSNASEGRRDGWREGGRKGETYETYSTQHKMCDGCLPCHKRVAHASRCCSGGIKGVGCVHVIIYMYNAAHTLASLVRFRANGLWLHIFMCYMRTRRMLGLSPWSGFSSSD